MEENFNRQSKLRLLKLNKLLSDEYQKYQNNNKTERNFPKSHHKLNVINYQNSLLHTQNNFYISKIANNNNNHSNKLDSVKRKHKNSVQYNLPYILKDKNKKKSNFNSGNRINTITGYNNYLKIKSNKAYMRMNRILMEQTLKRLAMPKFKKSKRGDRIWKEKSKSFSNEIIFDDDYYEEQKKKEKSKEKAKIVKKSKKYENLFEKEKMKSRARFKVLLKKNFRELDSCEKKFDIVIDKTMKLLSDYKNSLSYLKKE